MGRTGKETIRWCVNSGHPYSSTTYKPQRRAEYISNNIQSGAPSEGRETKIRNM